MNNNAIEEITKDLNSILETTNTIVLKTEEDRLKATEIIVTLKKKYDDLENDRTSIVKPINDSVKAINAKYKPFTEQIETAMTKLKRSISNFILEQERIAREKEEKELAKLAEKNAKREEQGKAPIIKTIESVARPESIMRSESGKTSTRKVWKFEIIDNLAVPLDQKYYSVDSSKIKAAVEAGERNIPGVRIFEDVIVGTYTK